MGHCFMIFVAAFVFHLGVPSQASPMKSKVEPAGDPHIQIHVHDKASLSSDAHMGQAPSLLEVVERSIQKERLPRRDYEGKKGLLMRSPVQKHAPLDNVATDRALPAWISGQRKEVDCSSSASNIYLHEFCRLLEGSSNAQVAEKLESVLKGPDLRTSSSDSTEVTIKSRSQQSHRVLLSNVRSSLLDLLFCARRTDCDVSHSQEPKIVAARRGVYDSLQALFTHMSGTAAPGSAPTDAHSSALIERGVPVAESSAWAQQTLANLLDKSKGDVGPKLDDAIHLCNEAMKIMNDMVGASTDSEAQIKKMHDAYLILHECATMPDCPITSASSECCDPKNPTQPRFKDARQEAYVAYNKLMFDESEEATAYYDLLHGAIGDTPATSEDTSGTQILPPEEPLYPPGHPNTGQIPGSTTTQPKVEAAVPEGNLLLYSICLVGGVVVLLALFLVIKSMTGKAAASPLAGSVYDAGGAEGGEQYW